MGLQFWPAAVELRGFNREEKIRELVGGGRRGSWLVKEKEV